MTEVRDAPVAWQYRFRPRGASAYYWTTWAPGRMPAPDANDDQIEFEERALYSASTVEALSVENEALLSRLEWLEKALKPFAAMADSWSEREPNSTMMDFHEEDGAHINLGHCRAARAALKEKTDGN